MKDFLPIITDDFLSPEGLKKLNALALKYKNSTIPGQVRTELDRPVYYFPRKKNSVHFLDPKVMNTLLTEIQNKLSALLKKNKIKVPLKFDMGQPQLSYYGPGDYYGVHQDKTELGITFILFFADKDFSGGVLKFHEDHGIEVTYQKNRAIIFSSHDKHEVTAIKGKGIRITLQFFLTSSKAHKKFYSEIVKNKKAFRKELIEFANMEILSPERMISLKYKILNFNKFTLEGVYQYIYFSLYNKLPVQVTSKIQRGKGLEIIVTSKANFSLKICVQGKKVWTEIIQGKKITEFDYLLLSQDIVQQLRKK